MKIIAVLFLLSLNGFFSALNAQSTKPFELKIEPVFGNAAWVEGTYFPLSKDDSVLITHLKFYLSNVAFYKDSVLVWAETNGFHLVDASNAASLSLRFDVPNAVHFDHIKCHLGIDSLTNVSGAMGGDLDPTRGMYWAWQSGYVNFKLEGKSNLCPTRKNVFQFHLGGYLPPFYGLQNLIFPITGQTDKAVIQVDIQQFLLQLDLKIQNSIMIPCEEAVLLAQKAQSIFKVKSEKLKVKN